MEEPISSALTLDLLRVELGTVSALINDAKGHRVTDQIKACRQLASEMGFVMRPSASSTICNWAPMNTRSASRNGGRRGECTPVSFADGSQGLAVELPGTHTNEPAFGLPLPGSDQAARGSIVPRLHGGRPGTVLTTHLTEVLKNHMAELLSYAETKKLLDDLPPRTKNVEELIPTQISVTGVRGCCRRSYRARLDPRSAGGSPKGSPKPSDTPRTP